MEPTIFTTPAPFDFLALDIETADGRFDDAERAMVHTWRPEAKWKPETIGQRYLEALDAKKEKLALLDNAPIVIVSLKSDDELRCLHCLRQEPLRELNGGFVEGFATAREMLVALRFGLDARCGPETVVVGHNILGFDLRKLRRAFVREGLKMPYALQSREQPVFDTMLEFGRRFTIGDKSPFVSLEVLLQEFGLPSHKGELDGSQVPRYVREGRFDELIAYALLDAMTEAELFLRMTGQLEDRPVEGDGKVTWSPAPPPAVLEVAL